MNEPETKLRDLPEMVCPQCQVIMIHGSTVQNPRPEIKRGDLYVCSKCACISRVADSGLVKMTPDEILKMDKQSKFNLASAVMAVQSKMAQAN